MQQSFYDKDFYKWSNEQVKLLKKGDYTRLDIKNIIEEIESLGKRDKRALKSEIRRLLHHLLKLNYASEYKGNSNSWDSSILTAREHIWDLLDDSPSLKKELPKIISDVYNDSLELAVADCAYNEELFPKSCPWTIKEILKN